MCSPRRASSWKDNSRQARDTLDLGQTAAHWRHLLMLGADNISYLISASPSHGRSTIFHEWRVKSNHFTGRKKNNSGKGIQKGMLEEISAWTQY